MRQWINDNPAVAAAVITIVVALLIWVLRPASSRAYEQQYFWDIGAGELVVMPGSTLPPVDGPSGRGQAVVAVVMACGSCADESSHFVARLETYAPEAQQLVRQMATERSENDVEARRLEQQVTDGTRVAEPMDGPGEPQWAPMASPAAARLMAAPAERCGGAPVVTCSPQSRSATGRGGFAVDIANESLRPADQSRKL